MLEVVYSTMKKVLWSLRLPGSHQMTIGPFSGPFWVPGPHVLPALGVEGEAWTSWQGWMWVCFHFRPEGESVPLRVASQSEQLQLCHRVV